MKPIAAWRRATIERDASVAVVALAEALEFYAAGIDVPSLFTARQMKAERKAALGAVAGELDPERIDRITWRLGQLNEPPTATRLRAAIAADNVPCNDPEFALLQRIRELRRRVGHGEARELATENELRQAIALVNRLLMYRLRRTKA